MGKEPRFITYKGVTKTASEWGRLKGLNHSTICNRLNLGWSIEKTLETPVTATAAGKKRTMFCKRMKWEDCLECPFPDDCICPDAPLIKGEAPHERGDTNVLVTDDYTDEYWFDDV